ncbi:hypothetical protein TNCV_2170941 [Trichonephila clavipes]|nr:hypothetical protein TNCV_2170941 [Trichonephila clavipes]
MASPKLLVFMSATAATQIPIKKNFYSKPVQKYRSLNNCSQTTQMIQINRNPSPNQVSVKERVPMKEFLITVVFRSSFNNVFSSPEIQNFLNSEKIDNRADNGNANFTRSVASKAISDRLIFQSLARQIIETGSFHAQM